MLFFEMFLFVILIGFIVFFLWLLNINNNPRNSKLEIKLGEKINKRIMDGFYKVATRGNHYVEYDEIQDEDVDDFIKFWYYK